jgi:hypothetical protein
MMLSILFAGLLWAAGLTYQAPAEWDKLESGSTMRVAEWKLAPASGDSEEARVIVFYFGKGGGGSVEANLERWYGQFEQPDKASSRERARVTKLTVGAFQITRADLSGTYVAPVRPGADERLNKPDFRMIAAIVEGGQGPWFIRLLGPKATVARWEKSFDQFLGSLRPGD